MLAFTYSKSLSHRVSLNSRSFFFHIPMHHYGVHKKVSLLAITFESVASFLYSKFRCATVVDPSLLVRFHWNFYCCDTHVK